jgi:rubredoxin
MKYHCEICSYIYDSEQGNPENGILKGIDLNDLPSTWVCPQCGVGKENFYLLAEDSPVPPGEAPQNIMIMALTQSLWQICGRGSCAVTREIGKLFITQLKSQGIELDSEEHALEMVKDYFIQVNKFARALDYEIKEDNVEIEVKNCRFFGTCSKLEDQSVLITTCPYSNTAAAALEEVNGFRYRIEKTQKDFGHHIVLTPISEINRERTAKIKNKIKKLNEMAEKEF